MDILRSILDGIAISAIFNGASAALVLIDPRFFLDSYPKSIQEAVPVKMTEHEHHVNNIFSIIVIGICVGYGVISTLHSGITGFWPLFWSGYINYMMVNLGDFFLLDCLLIQGKYKNKIIIPGTEGHPDYECKNWMKHLGVPEHFILWPFVLVPVFSLGQTGIVLLIRMISG